LPEGSSNDFTAFGGAMKAQKIAEAAAKEFGEDNIRFDSYPPKGSTVDFPVRERDGSIVSAQSKSQVLQRTPASAFDYVFVDKEILPKVKVWYEANRKALLAMNEEEQ